jgi:hypothetical protein
VSPKKKDLVNESRRKQSQTTKGVSSQSWLFLLITTNGPCSKAKYFYHSLAQEHFGAAKHYAEQHNIFDQYSLDPMDDSDWPEDLDAICIWDSFRSAWTRQPCSNAFHLTTGDGFRNTKFLPKVARPSPIQGDPENGGMLEMAALLRSLAQGVGARQNPTTPSPGWAAVPTALEAEAWSSSAVIARQQRLWILHHLRRLVRS